MSAFGRIQGGAETVIESLKALVGPEGLVVMPAFPIDGTGREHLSRDPLFDVRNTPSTMGAITEAFRKRKDVFRSLHPTHSVCAWGSRAEEFVAGHEQAATPFGEGTPFARLVEQNALQVWFGCRLWAITLYHAFECLQPSFPIRVFSDSTFAARCRNASGEPVIVHTPVHDPRLAPYRIDRRPDLEARFKLRLIQEGALQSLRLGKGEIMAARARPLFAAFERLLAEGLTIYALPTGRGE
ncbi:MAG: AAC(3) family N-acetyltransferase [Myxococcales bacterium]|nr:AAC(3) family N-acetyltransferase [Myxococcales bacterium]